MARFHHFCCCLPLRLGVLLVAIIGLLGGGLFAAGAWINVANMRKHADTVEYTREYEIALYVTAGVYTTMALVAFFGLVGAMVQKAGLVSLYLSLLITHFVLSVALGAYSLYSLYNKDNSNELTSKCTTQNANLSDSVGADTVTTICEGSLKIGKGIVVAVYCVIWLLELYTVVLVSSYVKELRAKKYPTVSYVKVGA